MFMETSQIFRFGLIIYEMTFMICMIMVLFLLVLLFISHWMIEWVVLEILKHPNDVIIYFIDYGRVIIFGFE